MVSSLIKVFSVSLKSLPRPSFPSSSAASLTQTEVFEQSGRNVDEGHLMVVSSCGILFTDNGALVLGSVVPKVLSLA